MSGPARQSLIRPVRFCRTGLRILQQAAVEFVYPPSCPFCGREDEGVCGGEVPRLCAGCRAALAPEIEHSCRRCAAPVGPHLETGEGCIHCRGERFRFASVIRLGVYEGPLGSACLQSKQPGRRPLAAALADLLWERERDRLEVLQPDWIVPVPHHWTQHLWRSHNASETLARVLARRLKGSFGGHILTKACRTEPQSALPPTRRRRNLRGAFRARADESLSGASVLLVDDVLTTGTTASEAAGALHRAGAGTVAVAVVARGLGAARSAGRA